VRWPNRDAQSTGPVEACSLRPTQRRLSPAGDYRSSATSGLAMRPPLASLSRSYRSSCRACASETPKHCADPQTTPSMRWCVRWSRGVHRLGLSPDRLQDLLPLPPVKVGSCYRRPASTGSSADPLSRGDFHMATDTRLALPARCPERASCLDGFRGRLCKRRLTSRVQDRMGADLGADG